jgi:hypothetical protein
MDVIIIAIVVFFVIASSCSRALGISSAALIVPALWLVQVCQLWDVGGGTCTSSALMQLNLRAMH